MQSPAPADRRESGQIIVLFGLALVALVAMVGLVLDGGSAFGQRRSEQNAADLAALAGANGYLLTNDEAQGRTAALAVARSNGYQDGVGGTTVTISFGHTTDGDTVQVDIGAAHRNNFAGIVGQPTWQVSTTATALSGIPDTAEGVAPFVFNIAVFQDASTGTPKPQFGDPKNPFAFNTTNADAPLVAGDLAWTDFAYDKPCHAAGNVDAATVKEILQGTKIITTTIENGCYIGQHNNGNMTTEYGDVLTYLTGHDVPVPVVDSAGMFQGWATFHVTGADGGSVKKVYGYFVSSLVQKKMTVRSCLGGSCPRYLGSYVLELVQ